MSKETNGFIKALDDMDQDVRLSKYDKMYLLNKYHNKVANVLQIASDPEDIFNAVHIIAHIKILIQKVENDV